MIKDLQQQVSQLDRYYEEGATVKRKSKLEKMKLKKGVKYEIIVDSQCKQLLIELAPSFSISLNNLLMTEYGLIVLNKPQIESEKILGEIGYNHESFTSRINSAIYNFECRYLQVQLEPVCLYTQPISAIKNVYKNFQVNEVLHSQEILNQVEKGEFIQTQCQFPFLLEPDWSEQLMENEDLPCLVVRVDTPHVKPVFTYLYNHAFIKMTGVMPNIFIDVILHSQRLPNVILEKDIILWNDKVLNFMKCNKQRIDREYTTMVVTYEGMKVSVKVKEIYMHTFDPDTSQHILVQKQRFQVLNQNVQKIIFDQHRINKNTVEFLTHNNVSETNKKINDGLLKSQEDEASIQYHKPRQCGYKITKI